MPSPSHLLFTTLKETARLRVEELVSTAVSSQFSLIITKLNISRGILGIPLNSPVHGSIGNDERGRHVENLVTETAEGVEDGGVEGAGQGPLTVGREGVGCDTLGGRAAWVVLVCVFMS